MLDKKINETIDTLIKKIKDNNLGSIKFSNKINSIEISNNSNDQIYNQNPIKSLSKTTNIDDTINNNLISIDSPMVGIIYLTPKPSSPPFAKKRSKDKEGWYYMSNRGYENL